MKIESQRSSTIRTVLSSTAVIPLNVQNTSGAHRFVSHLLRPGSFASFLGT